MFRRTSRNLLLAAAIAATPAAALAEGAVELAPHRALYLIELTGARDVVEAARGLAATEVRLTCDGWRYSQRYELELTPPAGAPNRTVFRMEGSESLDGRSYGFDAKTDYGDGMPLRLAGRAELDAEGAGEARYTEPGPITQPLPKGTAFPVGSLKAQLAAAVAGAERTDTFWFVGASPDEPLRILSIILPVAEASDAEGLLSGRRWRFVSGFYGDPTDPIPLYEGEETVLENGVLSEALYRYDGYSLQMTLQRLEPLPLPDC